MHWAAHGKTAAEKIYFSADSTKPNMGLYSFGGNHPIQARRHIPMYMKDWIETLDGFLKLSKHEILTGAGRISAAMAEKKAKEEYHKFKALQDGELSRGDRDFIAALDRAEKALSNYQVDKD